MANQQIDAILSDLRIHTVREMVALAAEVQSNLIADTPVDTGWARANWVVTVGQPAQQAIGSKAAVTQAAAAGAVLANYTFEQGSIFLTNNVQYIQRLNDGWSAQAPTLFVQAAIERALARRR